MSSHPKQPREARDLYVTPEWCADAVASDLSLLTHQAPSVLDPGCGTGVLGEAIRKWIPKAHIDGVDIHGSEWLLPDAYDRFQLRDFLEGDPPNERWDLVICNPPFSLTMPFIERGVKLLNVGGVAAFLVNMHALGSGARAWKWKQLKTRLLAQRILAPRPSFVRGTTDSTEYAWLLFGGPYPRRNPKIEPFDWYTRPGLLDELLKAEQRQRDKAMGLVTA